MRKRKEDIEEQTLFYFIFYIYINSLVKKKTSLFIFPDTLTY